MVAHGCFGMAQVLPLSDPVAETKSTWVLDVVAVAALVTAGTNVTASASIELVAAVTVARRRAAGVASRFLLRFTQRTLLVWRSGGRERIGIPRPSAEGFVATANAASERVCASFQDADRFAWILLYPFCGEGDLHGRGRGSAIAVSGMPLLRSEDATKTPRKQ